MTRWAGLAGLGLLCGGCSLLLTPELTAPPDGGTDEPRPCVEQDGGTTDSGGLRLAYGEACHGDLDCASHLCRDRRCSATCTPATGCPTEPPAECDQGECRFLAPPRPAGPLRVGFLYVGPVGDHGWSLTHDLSRRFLEEQLTSSEPGFATTYIPSVSAAMAPTAINQLLAEGNNIIVGTSFDFLTPVLAASANHPETNFLICSGFLTSPNLGSYFGRMYQPLWMAGMLAGRMTRSNRIGVVAPIPIPETVRHINAFTRGVRYVNLQAQVHVEWVGAWFDPVREPEVTRELVAAGADVLLAQTDTTIPLAIADELRTPDGRPVYTIGYDNEDSCAKTPDSCLTAAYWNWGPMMKAQLTAMAAGTWQPRVPIWEQMKSDPAQSSVYLAPISDEVPGSVRLEVEGWIPQLAAPGVEGQQLPFRAPVKDNQGQVRLAEGQTFADSQLLEMCWFVEGVIDTDPESDADVPAEVPTTCTGAR